MARRTRFVADAFVYGVTPELSVAVSDGAIFVPAVFANTLPSLSLFWHPLRTVLAVKGSLRRAQQRRALDRSGPFSQLLPENRERLGPEALRARSVPALPKWPLF